MKVKTTAPGHWSSSEPSEQSFFPLHFRFSEIQPPDLQENEPGVQVFPYKVRDKNKFSISDAVYQSSFFCFFTLVQRWEPVYKGSC